MTNKSIRPKIINVALSDFSYHVEFLRGYIFTDFPLQAKDSPVHVYSLTQNVFLSQIALESLQPVQN